MTNIERMVEAAKQRLARSIGTTAGIAAARLRQAAQKLREKGQG
jgi:hypothetical protein